MKRILVLLLLASVVFASPKWRIHDMERPNPNVVAPGEKSGQAPSDAIILFDGKNLDDWRAMDGGPAKWIVKNNVMESVNGAGYVRTEQCFGDCQLHVEFATPKKAEGKSQGRGNSGVFLMGQYEVQVLDNYENKTYADGQCSAIYAQYPPEVNVCRKPGEWQTYDIIFRAPRFCSKSKEILEPAYITVLQNGVITQNHVKILGPTQWTQIMPYEYHSPKLPISLQDHGNPVLYRNIWVRELPAPAPGEQAPRKQVLLAQTTMEEYVGKYEVNPGFVVSVEIQNGEFWCSIYGEPLRPMVAGGKDVLFSTIVNTEFNFTRDENGKVDGVVVTLAGDKIPAKRMK